MLTYRTVPLNQSNSLTLKWTLALSFIPAVAVTSSLALNNNNKKHYPAPAAAFSSFTQRNASPSFITHSHHTHTHSWPVKSSKTHAKRIYTPAHFGASRTFLRRRISIRKSFHTSFTECSSRMLRRTDAWHHYVNAHHQKFSSRRNFHRAGTLRTYVRFVCTVQKKWNHTRPTKIRKKKRE